MHCPTRDLRVGAHAGALGTLETDELRWADRKKVVGMGQNAMSHDVQLSGPIFRARSPSIDPAASAKASVSSA